MAPEPTPARLQRRLDRERKMRADAERIAEEVTSKLYSNNQELTAARVELERANAQVEQKVGRLESELEMSRAALRMAGENLAARLEQEFMSIEASIEGKAPSNPIALRQALERSRRLVRCLQAYGRRDGANESTDLQRIMRTVIGVAPQQAEGEENLPPVALDETSLQCLFEQLHESLQDGNIAGPAQTISCQASRHGTRILIRMWDARAGGPEDLPQGLQPMDDLLGAAELGVGLATCFRIVERVGGQLSYLLAEDGRIGWQLDLPTA